VIPIILIRPPTLTCGRCRTLLKRGKPRFGPAKIACGNCGLVIETGLTPWADLSLIKKAFVAIGEVIAPSRWGPFFFVLLLNTLLLLLFGLVFACILNVLLTAVAETSTAAADVLGGVLVGLVVLGTISLLVYRLVCLIKESNEYSRTGVPVVWKARIL
jgi:hypothetical protein